MSLIKMYSFCIYFRIYHTFSKKNPSSPFKYSYVSQALNHNKLIYNYKYYFALGGVYEMEYNNYR